MEWKSLQKHKPCDGQECIVCRLNVKTNKRTYGMYIYHHNGGKSAWLSKYGNKINSTNLDYWYSVNDMIENVEDRFNEELTIALQSFGL